MEQGGCVCLDKFQARIALSSNEAYKLLKQELQFQCHYKETKEDKKCQECQRRKGKQ